MLPLVFLPLCFLAVALAIAAAVVVVVVVVDVAAAALFASLVVAVAAAAASACASVVVLLSRLLLLLMMLMMLVIMLMLDDENDNGAAFLDFIMPTYQVPLKFEKHLRHHPFLFSLPLWFRFLTLMFILSCGCSLICRTN